MPTNWTPQPVSPTNWTTPTSGGTTTVTGVAIGLFGYTREVTVVTPGGTSTNWEKTAVSPTAWEKETI